MAVLVLAGSLIIGATASQAQSPGASDGARLAPTCTPPGTLAAASVVVDPPAESPPASLPDLTVFAAASLDKSFTALTEPWSATHPGSTLTLSFDASSVLRAQVEEGAPVDVFASADLRNPQTLIDECLALSPVTVFAANHLVVVVPTANPAGIESPADLAAPGVRIVAAGDDVPITRYAEEVIANLAAQPDAAAGYADAVHANVVSKEDNVSAVLAKIALGEGDAGIVYASDASTADGVTAIAIPDGADVLAHYGAVEVATTAVPDAATAFLGFLTGPAAQAVLAEYGFMPPL